MIAVEDDTEVRLIRAWDNDEIVDLYRAGGWWKEEYNPADILPLIRGSFAFAIASERRTGRAIGMGRVISDGISDGYIQDLVVLPQYRNSGIGTRIVAALMDRCRQAGVSWIALIAEPETEHFYLSKGFQVMEGHIPLIYRGSP